MDFFKNQNDLHIRHWEHFFNDESMARLYPTWWDDTTANHWRHERFLEAPLKLMRNPTVCAANWITIGDGSGHDTWILSTAGYSNILTTDIGVKTLARSLNEGRITRYERANAERLQYDDESFDFVLCKEALHHMQKPYAAIYEMLRVARHAVVIIEPQDRYIDSPCFSLPMEPTYEKVGNFVYSFSETELQKLSYGLNLPAVATKNMIDVYIEGCEFSKATDNDPVFTQMRQQVQAAEIAARDGKVKWNYILGVLFKSELALNMGNSQILESFISNGWRCVRTNTNPHMR